MKKHCKTILTAVVFLLLFLNPVSVSAKPGLLVFNPELLKFDDKYYIRNDFNAFCETLEKEAGYRVISREKNICYFSGPYHGLDNVLFQVVGKGNNEIEGVAIVIEFQPTVDWERAKEAHELAVSIIGDQVNAKDVVSRYSADEITDEIKRREALEAYEADYLTNFRKHNSEGFCYGEITVSLTWVQNRYCIQIVYIPNFH